MSSSPRLDNANVVKQRRKNAIVFVPRFNIKRHANTIDVCVNTNFNIFERSNFFQLVSSFLYHTCSFDPIDTFLAEVERFFEVHRLESATTIQAFFRGYFQRRRMTQGQRDRLVAKQAARQIQRTFRRYRQRKQAALDRRQQQLEYIKPSILTEAKREEIIEQIEQWRSERAVTNKKKSKINLVCQFLILAESRVWKRLSRSSFSWSREPSAVCLDQSSVENDRTTATFVASHDEQWFGVSPHKWEQDEEEDEKQTSHTSSIGDL